MSLPVCSSSLHACTVTAAIRQQLTTVPLLQQVNNATARVMTNKKVANPYTNGRPSRTRRGDALGVRTPPPAGGVVMAPAPVAPNGRLGSPLTPVPVSLFCLPVRLEAEPRGGRRLRSGTLRR